MPVDTSDDLVRGEALATPKLRAESELLGLLAPAAAALKAILLSDPHSYEKQSAAAFAKTQLTAAIYTLDAIQSIAAENGKQTKKAAQILAAVGGDAINREIMRRYAAKQRNTERQRIVEAVPAEADISKDELEDLVASAKVHVKGEADHSNVHVKGESDGIDSDSVSSDIRTSDDTTPPEPTPGPA